jgi:hypothetical protein
VTLDDFLSEPTKRDWCHEIAECGWPGPNGSSASTDAICGVRIGIKSPKYEYHNLPASEHDWRYQLGRRLSLPWEWSLPTDQGYRDGCLRKVRFALIGPFLLVAVVRCYARYFGLRARVWCRTLAAIPPWG